MKRPCAVVAVILALVNAVVIVAFWGVSSGALIAAPWVSGSPAIGWGRLAGLLLQFALLVQLLLIGRIPCIERAFGFDGLNRLHRWIGYSLAVLLILHPVFLSIGYAPLREQSASQTFVGIVTGFDDVLPALVGTVLLFGTIAVSVPWVRRRLRYESWHAAHLVTYLAIWLAFEHQVEIGGDFVNQSFYRYWYGLTFVVVGLVFLYRFLRPFMLWYRHRFTVERIVQETPDAWSVYITGRRMDAFRFKPGQFANLHLLSRGLWAGHPFSFSQEYDGRTLRFTIKELGDDTGLIRHLKPGVKVIVDGPLGVFTPDRAKTGKYLLIAGGIGVTPIRAIAGALASAGADEVVLYAARTRAHTALLGEMADRVRKMFVLLSQDAGPLPPGFLQGTIDARAIRSLVPDAAQRDVYICGPAAMMRAVTSALREVGVPARQIHSERFAY